MFCSGFKRLSYKHFEVTVRCVTNISVQGQGWVSLGSEFFGGSIGAVEILGQIRGTGCVLLVLRAGQLKADGRLP